jgi:hypothetical protein
MNDSGVISVFRIVGCLKSEGTRQIRLIPWVGKYEKVNLTCRHR